MSQKSFPYSLSGFIAEPSQSANVRVQILRPSNPADTVCREGRRCVFFFPKGIRAARIPNSQNKRAVRPRGVKRRGRPRVSISVASSSSSEDTGLSIRATPVQLRPGRPFSNSYSAFLLCELRNSWGEFLFLKEAPVLDPPAVAFRIGKLGRGVSPQPWRRRTDRSDNR